MDRTENILDALSHLQERVEFIRHGRAEVVGGVGLAEMHCVDWIGRLERANVTRIAARMDMTRGAVCKIAKRLLAKGLVESYRLPDNNKEIYYRLTAGGRRVFDEHSSCHAEARRAKTDLLAAYDEGEQAVILRFLNDINRLFASQPEEKL